MQRIDDVPMASCWSIFEGCVCRHLKHHFGTHACDDRECNNAWTTEDSIEWLEAESKGQTVNDRHRSPREELDS